MYFIDEDDGLAQPVLVLSNPSSSDITVEVFDTSVTVTGEFCNYLYTAGIFKAVYL